MISELAGNIEATLKQIIRDKYGVAYDSLNFTTPPRIEMGELALPVAFDLARKVRRVPRELALELARAAQSVPGVWKVEVAGAGYLNFYLDRGLLPIRLARSIEAERYGLVSAPADNPGKIIVEHTNINPNKAAHIGHLRNAAIGDAFVRVLRFLGCTVEVQNYLDNTGVQVADVVVGLERMLGKTLEDVAAIDGKFDYYCWDVYARVSQFYKESEENQKWRSLTLQAIEEGNNPTAELAEHVAMRIAGAHLATMKRINVYYDLLPRESEILHLHFWQKAFELLRARGAIYYVEEGKNAGCWVMKTGEGSQVSASREDQEEDEKIIVRSDGTVTYVGKDVAYQLWKFGLLGLDFQYRPFQDNDGRTLWMTATEEIPGLTPPHFGGARRVYNVIDTRQSYLQNIVLQGLSALGFKEQAANSTHFSYEMVALTPTCCEELGYQLSDEEKKRSYIEVAGRKGLGVKADDLLDTLVAKAFAEVRSRHDIDPQQAEEIARIIAVGALRYFLLRFARTTVIAFDFKEALSFEGETGPYVQYAIVRANNIFRKLEGTSWEELRKNIQPAGIGAFFSAQDDIWELVYQAARLPEIARQVQQSLELSLLCKFAFHLAQKFNLFYHKYHILSEPDSERKACLLFVVDLVRSQLAKALDLLGCEVPPIM